jgi:hypothetical protein
MENDIKELFPDSKHELSEDEFKAILDVITGRKRKKIQENKGECEENKRNECRELKPEYETLLKMRWWKAVNHLQLEAKINRDRYFLFSTIVIILSAITTALSGINFAESTKIFPINLTVTKVPLITIIQASILLSSLIVTITIAFIKLKQYNEVYMNKFKYAERLKKEGFQFFQLIGDYSNCSRSYNEAFPKLGENVEKIINEINELYVDLWKKTP